MLRLTRLKAAEWYRDCSLEDLAGAATAVAQPSVRWAGQAGVIWDWVVGAWSRQRLPSPPLCTFGGGEKAVDDAGAGDDDAGRVEVSDVALAVHYLSAGLSRQ